MFLWLDHSFSSTSQHPHKLPSFYNSQSETFWSKLVTRFNYFIIYAALLWIPSIKFISFHKCNFHAWLQYPFLGIQHHIFAQVIKSYFSCSMSDLQHWYPSSTVLLHFKSCCTIIFHLFHTVFLCCYNQCTQLHTYPLELKKNHAPSQRHKQLGNLKSTHSAVNLWYIHQTHNLYH